MESQKTIDGTPFNNLKTIKNNRKKNQNPMISTNSENSQYLQNSPNPSLEISTSFEKRKNSSPSTSPSNELTNPKKVGKNLENSSMTNYLTANSGQKKSTPADSSPKPNNPLFSGHRLKEGISLLVIHKFEGISKTYPKFVPLILDNVLGQSKMPSVASRLKTELVLFWELDDLVFTMAKSETFVSFGFRQSDFPTILPSGSKVSPARYPTLMDNGVRGLEWLKLAIDNLPRPSPTPSSPLDRLISDLAGPPSSQDLSNCLDPESSQDSDSFSAPESDNSLDHPPFPSSNLFGQESENPDPPEGSIDSHPLNSLPPNPPSFLTPPVLDPSSLELTQLETNLTPPSLGLPDLGMTQLPSPLSLDSSLTLNSPLVISLTTASPPPLNNSSLTPSPLPCPSTTDENSPASLNPPDSITQINTPPIQVPQVTLLPFLPPSPAPVSCSSP